MSEAAGGRAEVVEGAVVVEQPGCGGGLFGEGHLRGEPLIDLVLRETIACCESGPLQGRGAGDDEESIEAAVGATLDEQRSGVDDERGAGREGCGDGLLAGHCDAGMEDGVESSAGVGVCEDDGAKRSAVEVAGRQEKVWAEGSDDLAEAVAAGRDDRASELVGIDDGCSAVAEKAFDGALAAGDASGESDASRRWVDLRGQEAQLTPI